jgi:predicted small secreted protein
MTLRTTSPALRLAAVFLAASSLGACNTFTRLSQVGQ